MADGVAWSARVDGAHTKTAFVRCSTEDLRSRPGIQTGNTERRHTHAPTTLQQVHCSGMCAYLEITKVELSCTLNCC